MQNARILVVDDEKSIRFTFERFLSQEGYAVDTARDYGEALEKISATDFDLVFADILLGGMTGLDVLRDVMQRNRGCPVVMITGYPDIETASEAVRLRAFDYIHKPVKKETLLRVTGTALKHKALSDEKERYRLNLEAIFRSVKDALITVDRDLLVVEVNEAAGRICGFSRDAIGRAFSSLPQACSGRCLAVLLETIRRKETVETSRFECQHKNRPLQVVTLTASPLLDHQGMFSGAVMAVSDETRLDGLERDLNERHRFHNIIGRNRKMQALYSLIEDLADVQTTVLITGESGTGKELVAEALHYMGSRGDKPLVKVNCAALTEGLLESELFGHVQGAFTGAVRDKTGRFQRADGGTIFLDEIGDISQGIQRRLLRVLQEQEFERVGDSTPVRVDVRIIAATNQDLYAKVISREFREDLYYRLKVVEIVLPPLRDRREDIPLLADHFIRKFNKKMNRNISGVSSDVRALFMNHVWRGNIRELEHVLEHAFILCKQDIITVDDLPPDLKPHARLRASRELNEGVDDAQAVRRALEKSGWNKAKAARMLGMDRKTIYRKIDKYKISERYP